MRWAQGQRLAFIGDRLASGALLRRSEICEKFGISIPQASLDLRRFMEMNPGAIRYDRSRKGYVLDGWKPPIKTKEEPAEFCHPGDDRRKRWILLFEDPDQGMNIYYDEAEAHQAFEMATTNWNCHLFVSALRQTDH